MKGSYLAAAAFCERDAGIPHLSRTTDFVLFHSGTSAPPPPSSKAGRNEVVPTGDANFACLDGGPEGLLFWGGNCSFRADKLEKAEGQLAHSRFGGMLMPSQWKKEVIKDILFNSVDPSSKASTSVSDSSGPEPMVQA